MTTPQITLFTPAYNRAATLPRLYEAIKRQTFRDFEWIIIDDGSEDDTRAVVEQFIAEDDRPPIIYRFQQNQGKHNATNAAVKLARGALFVTIDSDDSMTDNALETLVDEWKALPDADKPRYKGISCRTCAPDGVRNGSPLPQSPLDCSDLDLRFKYKVTGELWGMTQTEILRQNPYPAVEGLHFYPENIYWDNMGRRYLTRFIDVPLRVYINDQQNALTDKRNSAHSETYYMRLHFLNECMDYFRYKPAFFMKQALGLWRDGRKSGRAVGGILADVPHAGGRAAALVMLPAGLLLSLK